ncbi:MAG: PAS domain S-box protein, partial [Anaerolineales bacterium]|nr:PAS domain S-box protein [Anaerolineales bacterium]
TGLILPFPSHLAAGGNGRSEAAWTTLFEEALHRREPVIHNNPNVGNSSANRPFLREIVVPVIRNSKVTAVLGVADKCTDYTADDLTLVATLSDFAWDVIEHKQSEIALRHSEQRFRTIADWTYAWEMWLDPQGNILYTSPASERITGYTSEDFITHSDLLINIIHPDDRQFYRDHERILHDPAADPVSIEYRILARDGQEYWLEHVCRPLWAPDDTYLGRRVSNRDVTQRKLNEQQIVEQLQKEAMLTQTIQNIQTDIARDLHDTLGQNISFLCLGLEDLSTTAVTGQTDPTILIQNMLTAANESYDLIRAMLHMLQSGYSADLLSLFTRYASQVAERSAIKIEVKSYGLAKSQLTPQQIRQLFFIFREALNNVEKHAHASQVSSEFHWQEQSLTLRITDNGQGFYQNPVQTSDHYGLKFMHERAEQIKGQLLVQSTLDEGTAITVIIPFENGNSSALL